MTPGFRGCATSHPLRRVSGRDRAPTTIEGAVDRHNLAFNRFKHPGTTVKPLALSASGAIPAKKPDVACFARLEGAVDYGNCSCCIDGQFPHQQALPATVVTEGRIGCA